ncbi:hypothetical protein PAHAL_6G077400 [Panicum hallii]|nr:hypothetical protein PAHAL_6G077400 [Panicum hallii]
MCQSPTGRQPDRLPNGRLAPTRARAAGLAPRSPMALGTPPSQRALLPEPRRLRVRHPWTPTSTRHRAPTTARTGAPTPARPCTMPSPLKRWCPAVGSKHGRLLAHRREVARDLHGGVRRPRPLEQVERQRPLELHTSCSCSTRAVSAASSTPRPAPASPTPDSSTSRDRRLMIKHFSYLLW